MNQQDSRLTKVILLREPSTVLRGTWLPYNSFRVLFFYIVVYFFSR